MGGEPRVYGLLHIDENPLLSCRFVQHSKTLRWAALEKLLRTHSSSVGNRAAV
jgi:hypothetical protein